MTAMPTELQTEAMAGARNRTARAIARSMGPKLIRVLESQTNEAVQRTSAGMVNPVPPDARTRWARELYAAQIQDGRNGAILGWNSTREQFGLEKAEAGEWYALSPTDQQVEDYFGRTSKMEAKTHADEVNKTFERVKKELVRSVKPDGTVIEDEAGLDPAKLSRALQQGMLGFDRRYANLIARTGSNWAMNAGSKSAYKSAGVTKLQWWTVIGDRTCPFCSSLHKKVVGIEDPFVDAGDSVGGVVQGADGGTRAVSMTVPKRIGNINHPPLHPNCRCTIVADRSSLAQELERLAEEDADSAQEAVAPDDSPATPALPDLGFTRPTGSLPNQAKETMNVKRVSGRGYTSAADKATYDEILDQWTGEMTQARNRLPGLNEMIEEGGDKAPSVTFHNRAGWGTFDERIAGEINKKGAIKIAGKPGNLPGVGRIDISSAEPFGGADWSVDKSITGTARHEYGHAMHKHALGRARTKDVQSWGTVWEEEGKDISGYGATSSSEGFAEAFSVFTHPQYGKKGKRLPKKVERWMMEVLG